MHVAATNAPDAKDAEVRRALARAGLPPIPAPGTTWIGRLLASPWPWLTALVLMVEGICLWATYLQVVPDRQVPGGTMVGLGTDAIGLSAQYAAYTVVPLALVFLLADRFRPMRLWICLVAFGWGGCVATYLSMQLNTWAAAHMAVQGNGDPASAARAAVFVAPFVEESMKATILFLIAICLRNRWVGRLSGIVLAGLSASAFAFTENILYYGRAYRAASRTMGATPEDFVQQLFLRRGVMTFFAHPLFTCMTGIGLAIALRSRSRIVRVMAPLVGFLAAALLHMLFNGMASSGMPESGLTILLVMIAWPMVIALAAHTVREIGAQRRLIAARLTDYARMGWLPDSDPASIPPLRGRVRMLWQALWGGRVISTWRVHRNLIELAYLRDGMTRGLIDSTGWVREKQLLLATHELRARAITEPLPRTVYPWERWRRRRPMSPGVYGQPAALGVGYQGGAIHTAPVDPAWGPPGSQEAR